MGLSMVLASEWDCDCNSGMEGVDEEGMKSPPAAGRHAAGSPGGSGSEMTSSNEHISL